jgi:hypothetical protein
VKNIVLETGTLKKSMISEIINILEAETNIERSKKKNILKKM